MAVNLEDLTPEQIEKGKACRTPEELLALAKEEGVELTDDQLDQISGGNAWARSTPIFWIAPIAATT